MWLDGKHILVTGASRGIGRALTEQLLAEGAYVLAVARDSEALRSLRWELGDRVQVRTCNLEDRDERSVLIEELKIHERPLDGIINNAGLQFETDYLAASYPDLSQDIATEVNLNLEAPIHLSAELAPVLSLRPDGFIVNVTSALALAPKTDAPVYCATKAGLSSFTKALRYQVRRNRSQLLVSDCIMPLVETDMTQGRGHGKIPPHQAAQELLQGLKGHKTQIWIGKTRLLRLVHRLIPELSARILQG